jgi:hypothetical protein
MAKDVYVGTRTWLLNGSCAENTVWLSSSACSPKFGMFHSRPYSYVPAVIGAGGAAADLKPSVLSAR